MSIGAHGLMPLRIAIRLLASTRIGSVATGMVPHGRMGESTGGTTRQCLGSRIRSGKPVGERPAVTGSNRSHSRFRACLAKIDRSYDRKRSQVERNLRND
jgi:hypothetical protein